MINFNTTSYHLLRTHWVPGTKQRSFKCPVSGSFNPRRNAVSEIELVLFWGSGNRFTVKPGSGKWRRRLCAKSVVSNQPPCPVLSTRSCVRAQLCPALCGPMNRRLLYPWDSPGKNTGVDCQALLQGIFPTQGSNLCLLRCRCILYCWAITEALPLGHRPSI